MKNFYGKIKGWFVDGKNIKRDKTERIWKGTCTGRAKAGKGGARLIEVVDFALLVDREVEDPRRWLNIETFTGKIGSVELAEGCRIGKLNFQGDQNA